jgi:hypothetical protein
MSEADHEASGQRTAKGWLWRARSRLVAAVALLVVIVGGGIALATGTGSSAPPPESSDGAGQPAQDASERQTIGPGMSAGAAIAHVLASLGDPAVTWAHLFNNPTNVTGALRLMIHVDSDEGGGQRPVWLGELVQGAVADLMRTDEATTSQVMPGSRVVDRNAHGQRVVTELGSGAAAGGQQFGSPSDADLRERMSQVAAGFGLTVQSVQVLHPLDSAVSVTFTVPDGAVPWTLYQLLNAVKGSPQDIEGYFVELDSPTGEPLLQAEGASRIAGGGLWFAPGQDDRFGAVHG